VHNWGIKPSRSWDFSFTLRVHISLKVYTSRLVRAVVLDTKEEYADIKV